MRTGSLGGEGLLGQPSAVCRAYPRAPGLAVAAVPLRRMWCRVETPGRNGGNEHVPNGVAGGSWAQRSWLQPLVKAGWSQC